MIYLRDVAIYSWLVRQKLSPAVNLFLFGDIFGVFYPLICQENIVMGRRKLCDGTDVLPYIFSWTACFFSSVFRCVGVLKGYVLKSIPIPDLNKHQRNYSC